MSTESLQRPELHPRFAPEDHDPLITSALLVDEVAQRRESGYDVDDVVRAANDLDPADPSDDAAVLALVDAMADAPRGPWHHEEPDGLTAITDTLPDPPAPVAVDAASYPDQVHAAWLGRVVGCTLGKPVEWGDHWTPEHIAAYLRLASAYPLTDYVPVLKPVPAGFDLHDSWPETTRGNVDGAARDDDIDYTVLALQLLERHGSALSPEDVAAAWTTLLPLRQVYTAERAAYVNLAVGLRPPVVATHRNPYREWIGAQIRGDAYGYVHPGDPWAAARLAFADASLSHTGNGVYGAMWSAALVAAAFTAGTARRAVETALRVVPPTSRLAVAVRGVLDLRDAGTTWDDALAQVREEHARYAWVHTINNAAVVTLSLLWWGDDHTAAVGRTVMSGWDTDSNGATVGSVTGILVGRRALAEHLVAPLHDRARSAIFGVGEVRISALAERTLALGPGGARSLHAG